MTRMAMNIVPFAEAALVATKDIDIPMYHPKHDRCWDLQVQFREQTERCVDLFGTYAVEVNGSAGEVHSQHGRFNVEPSF